MHGCRYGYELPTFLIKRSLPTKDEYNKVYGGPCRLFAIVGLAIARGTKKLFSELVITSSWKTLAMLVILCVLWILLAITTTLWRRIKATSWRAYYSPMDNWTFSTYILLPLHVKIHLLDSWCSLVEMASRGCSLHTECVTSQAVPAVTASRRASSIDIMVRGDRYPKHLRLAIPKTQT